MLTHGVRAAHMLWATLAMVGCGGEAAQDGAVVKGEPSKSRTIEACSLLTPEEIAAVTGAEVAD